MQPNDKLEPIAPAEAKEMYTEQRKEEVSKSTIQAHHYRLKHFVRWCEDAEDIKNLNTITGRDLQRYKMWRREDGNLNNVTMVTQLSTLRVFIRWCEKIDAVASGTHDNILIPSLAKNEDRRTASIDKGAATRLINYLRKFEFSTRTHALIELLWHTGMRIGAAHSLDLEDYDRDEQYVELHHRPDTSTRLKNKTDGERYVSLSAEVCDALEGTSSTTAITPPTSTAGSHYSRVVMEGLGNPRSATVFIESPVRVNTQETVLTTAR